MLVHFLIVVFVFLPAVKSNAGLRIPRIRELLPLPETPESTVNLPIGILTSKLFRLFMLAPFTSIHPPEAIFGNFLLEPLIGCLTFLLKAVTVGDFVCFSEFFSSILSWPSYTTSPPLLPAPGPKSMR